jgi:hypothetical protein
MKKINLFIALITLFVGCTSNEKVDSIPPTDWSERTASIANMDSLEYGKSYLSIYSQMYSESEHRTYNLTAMVSIRNTSDQDTIYISSTNYFDTDGNLIKTYLESPIFLAPMQTIEIIIQEHDISGGTGSNFLFEWYTPQGCPEPLFEGIMNSINARGMSFITLAKRIK